MFDWAQSCVCATLLTLTTHKLAIVMFKDSVLNTELKFYVAAVHNILFAMVSCSIDASVMTLPNIFISYTVAIINQLSKKMENVAMELEISDDNNKVEHDVERENRYMRELINCVSIHRKVRGIAQEIEEYFSPIVLVQGLMSSMIFCTIIYFLAEVSLETFEET